MDKTENPQTGFRVTLECNSGSPVKDRIISILDENRVLHKESFSSFQDYSFKMDPVLLKVEKRCKDGETYTLYDHSISSSLYGICQSHSLYGGISGERDVLGNLIFMGVIKNTGDENE